MTQTEEDFEFQSAVENPEALAAAAAAASFVEATQAPEIPVPLDGPVTLVAGFRRAVTKDGTLTFEDVRKAWVRELNGEDEERIARAKMKDDRGEFINAILEAGVSRLGDSVPTREDIQSLVLGDRDFLLLEISRATYGNDLEYNDFPCPFDGEKLDFTVHLNTDVPIRRLDSLSDTTFDVRLKNDRVATVRLPTVEISEAMVGAETGAETVTLLITNCVDEIRGPKGTVRVAGDAQAAKSLGIQDRQKLVFEMNSRMPGPQYNEVTFKHETCGQEVRVDVVLADLFPGL